MGHMGGVTVGVTRHISKAYRAHYTLAIEIRRIREMKPFAISAKQLISRQKPELCYPYIG